MKEWTTKIASFLSQLRIELATYKKKLEMKAEPVIEEKIKPPEIPMSNIQEEQVDYSHHDEPIETYSRHEYRQDDTLEHAHDLEHYHDEKDEHTHDEHDRTLENHNVEPEHEVEDHNNEQEDHILEQEKENPNLSPIEEQKSFEQEEEEESVHEHHPKTPARISFQSPVVC
jgi:GTPase involved in cell partitioning and DNA repair